MFEFLCSIIPFCPQEKPLDIVTTETRNTFWNDASEANPQGIRKIRDALTEFTTPQKNTPDGKGVYNPRESFTVKGSGFAIWGQGGVISNTNPNLFGGRDLIIPDNIPYICLAPKEVKYTDHNIYEDLSKILRQCRQSAR